MPPLGRGQEGQRGGRTEAGRAERHRMREWHGPWTGCRRRVGLPRRGGCASWGRAAWQVSSSGPAAEEGRRGRSLGLGGVRQRGEGEGGLLLLWDGQASSGRTTGRRHQRASYIRGGGTCMWGRGSVRSGERRTLRWVGTRGGDEGPRRESACWGAGAWATVRHRQRGWGSVTRVDVVQALRGGVLEESRREGCRGPEILHKQPSPVEGRRCQGSGPGRLCGLRPSDVSSKYYIVV